jgi:hypothetical protein
MAEEMMSPGAKRSAELTAQVVNDQQFVVRTALCGGDKNKYKFLYEHAK